MANELETTFGSLQSDERYKKLERTLKMALLRNAEQRSTDNVTAPAATVGMWPNVSSINGDHSDTGSLTTSVRSSRIGSEVVSSSMNLRNILLHKQHFVGSRNNAATSSENQFPTGKDNDDSAMMPPPRTPTITARGRKSFDNANQRAPSGVSAINSARNSNGFSISTPAACVPSITELAGPTSNDPDVVYQQNDNYHVRNGYGNMDGDGGAIAKQERSFCKWRVLLNDKSLLIIKGTLECGKVARSKPVIRRLTPTSVQSIFKHTYHLRGNLVDDRGELPDYVRGKFYNGFPDDWENVYQVWRNFVSDGNRLSFRWPTAMTDSDDDIKSEITEMSHRSPERYEKPASGTPQKRVGVRSSRSSSALDSSVANDENRPITNSCRCSCNASRVNPLEMSILENHVAADNSQRQQQSDPSTRSRQKLSLKDHATRENHEKSYDRSALVDSIPGDNKSENSFAGIMSEDKLNSIIDNLADKNCPTEYINKIVQMFDCIKYITSYHSSVGGNAVAEKPTLAVQRDKEASRIRSMNDRSAEKINDASDSARLKNLSLDNANFIAENVKKIYDDQDRPSRRKLTKRDYDSSSSDNENFYDDDQTNSIRVSTSSYGRLKNPDELKKNCDDSVDKRTSRMRVGNETEKSFVRPLRQRGNRAIRDIERIHDFREIDDDAFASEKKRETKFDDNEASAFAIVGRGKENRRPAMNNDSSIDVTDDESHYAENSKVVEKKNYNYDSSVSITEDERGCGESHVRITTKPRNYSETNREIRRNFDYRDVTKKSDVNHKSEANFRNHVKNLDDERLNYLDYYSETKSLDRGKQQQQRNIDANPENRDSRKIVDRSNYRSDSNSRPVVDHHARENRDVIDDANERLNSIEKHGETNYRRTEQDAKKNVATKNSRIPRKKGWNFVSASRANDDHDPNVKIHGVAVKSNHRDSMNEQEDDSAYLSSDIKRAATKITNEDSGTTNRRSNDEPEISAVTKIKTTPLLMGKKKHTVVSTETVDIDLRWEESNGEMEIDEKAIDSPKKFNDANDQIDCGDNVEAVKVRTRSREAMGNVHKIQDNKSSSSLLREKMKIGNVESNAAESLSNELTVDEYGSEKNPKLLTAWVPVVVFDDDDDKKCHLIFEGKLLNEAGHVANRKFVTDVVRRRLSPKIIETIGHEFYNLVGDLNDTKHVVPKELMKLCHNGCPGRIGHFCERWKALTGATIYKSPPNERLNNTSVDCLSVPTSSRGRRILPPLNYWSGERVVTKDNKIMYSPGNTLESSIHSSWEHTTREVKTKPADVKRTNSSRSTEINKKDAENIPPPTVSKSTAQPSPPEIIGGSEKTRSYKRRVTRNMQVASESDDGADTKATPRKRKTKVNEKVSKTDIHPARMTRTRGKNSASPQSPEVHERISPRKSSQKRRKIDDAQPTLQQFVTRKPEVKCTYYKNVPMHDGDLSEDQLSTM